MDNPNIMPMIKFVTDEVSSGEMSDLIDEVLFDYAIHKLEEGLNDKGAQQAAQKMYLLRQLRDVFAEM